MGERNGFLYDSASPHSIAHALSSVCHLSIEEMLTMGELSKQKAISLFSVNTILNKWINII